MCGVCGVFAIGGAHRDQLSAITERMANRIGHRGPDDVGVWSDHESGIALGHRRLAIIDLSPAGHQPMHSHGKKYVIAFNGEIYNHMELRAEIEASGSPISWRGHSDTETLLAAFELWGFVDTLNKLIGMFAIALWDTQERRLWLARDRFGEKPLYYGWVGGADDRAFVFGSELKALRAYSGFANRVSRPALAEYMKFAYVPAPMSIYEGIYKLEPGCALSVDGSPPSVSPSLPPRPGASISTLSVTRWWSLSEVVTQSTRLQITDEIEAQDELERTLSEAVRSQSNADVPLGAFLSGGVDSSVIVALMQQQAARPVETFTIGFEETAYDESDYARAVAHHLGTPHTELIVTSREAQNVIYDLPEMYDEPFADSSQIPTHLVCRAARQHVTVALSGDAGDELFGGYNRYFWGPRIWRRLSWMPQNARAAIGAALSSIPVETWDTISRPLLAGVFGSRGISRIGEKLHKLSESIRAAASMEEMYKSLVTGWHDPSAVVLDLHSVTGSGIALDDPLPVEGATTAELRMMYWDSVTYLPDDILCKVDRAAMACGLETRVPFLDHRVATLAWRLPLDMKIRSGEGKRVLRQVLHRHVPKQLIDRAKIGFGIPVGDWLRGPLREWAEDLLRESRLREEGYFRAEVVSRIWNEHLSGRRDHTVRIWTVLMFQAWLASLSRDSAGCAGDALASR